MIWVDYAFIGIVLFSVLVGVLRGLVREALSLIAWVLAFVLTLRFAPTLAETLEGSIQTPAVRTAAAYALLFFAVLLMGSLVTWLVSLVVKSIGLGGVDRMLGAGFGLMRGLFVVTAAVLLAGESAAKSEPWWRASVLIPQVEPFAAKLHRLIPEQWFAYLRPRDTNPKPEH